MTINKERYISTGLPVLSASQLDGGVISLATITHLTPESIQYSHLRILN